MYKRGMLMRVMTAMLLLGPTLPLAAGPAQVNGLIQQWDRTSKDWLTQLRAATTPETRAAAMAARPDLAATLRQLWLEISPALEQPWTLEGAAWFLRAADSLRTNAQADPTQTPFANEVRTIRKAVETHHLRSPGLEPMCLALATSSDPQTLALLQSIETKHPDPKVQGVAALAVSLVLKSIGDSPEIMRKRLTALQKAIIASAEVPVLGTTVAKIAEDELYCIRFLAKGRTAPDLTGTDSAGRPLQLSTNPAKVTVLLFWSSTMPEAERVMEMTRKLQQAHQAKGLAVLGVNLDPLPTLRELEGKAESPVCWKNFSDPEGKLARDYRVAAAPLVFVLDANRKIHFVGLPGSFVDLTAEALLSEG